MTRGRKEAACSFGCPIEAVLDVIGGRWKAVILYHLLKGTHRFNELRRAMPRVTQRMLTRQLRELEADGLINREIYAEVPPKVEYSLTEMGHSLKPIMGVIQKWGAANLERIVAIREAAN